MPKFEDLSSDQIELVKASLWSRQYYLLTGSGISLDSNGPSGEMKSSADLKTTLCDHLKIPSSRSLQQAYSLLNGNEISAYITDPYKCISPGGTVTKLVNYPWKRIFTLNVDDCLEEAISKLLSQQVDLKKQFEIKNYLDDFSDFSPLNVQSVIHLHGLVKQAERGYIFSHSEYAKNIARLICPL